MLKCSNVNCLLQTCNVIMKQLCFQHSHNSLGFPAQFGLFYGQQVAHDRPLKLSTGVDSQSAILQFCTPSNRLRITAFKWLLMLGLEFTSFAMTTLTSVLRSLWSNEELSAPQKLHLGHSASFTRSEMGSLSI